MGLNLKSKIKQTAYRLKLRKALQEASYEQLEITREELRRETERRTRKK